jgi:hypothetical protein
MGYTTKFEGELLFGNVLTNLQEQELLKFLGEDCRDHPEWKSGDLTHIDLEFNEDKSGIRWNGSEKTYELPEKINLIISKMCEKFPEFSLIGTLEAQGEEHTDRWNLEMENNKAIHNDYP